LSLVPCAMDLRPSRAQAVRFSQAQEEWARRTGRVGDVLARGTCSVMAVAAALALVVVTLSHGLVSGVYFAVMVVCTVTTTVGMVAPLVSERPAVVPLGLVASVFWVAATAVVSVAFVINSALMRLWVYFDPRCSALYPYDLLSDDVGRAWWCTAVASLEWVLTPGLVEEGAKALVLLHLHTTVTGAARSRWAGRLRKKLWSGLVTPVADNPWAFTVCGVAIGGGFATAENVWFVFLKDPDATVNAVKHGDLGLAMSRLLPLHQLLTGYISAKVAFRLFGPAQARQPEEPLSRVFLRAVVVHGCFDAAVYLASFCEEWDEEHGAPEGYVPRTRILQLLMVVKMAVVAAAVVLFHSAWSDLDDLVPADDLPVQQLPNAIHD